MTLFGNQASEINSIAFNLPDLISRHCRCCNLATTLLLPNKQITRNMMVAKQRKQHILSPYHSPDKTSIPTAKTTVYRQNGLRLSKTLKMNFNINITEKNLLKDQREASPPHCECSTNNRMGTKLKTLSKSPDIKEIEAPSKSNNENCHNCKSNNSSPKVRSYKNSNMNNNNNNDNNKNNNYNSSNDHRHKRTNPSDVDNSSNNSTNNIDNEHNNITNNTNNYNNSNKNITKSPDISTCVDKFKSNKHNNNNNISKDSNTLQVRLSLDLNIRNYKILHHFKMLNLNLRVTVNDLRKYKESLASTIVKHKVDYTFRGT